MLAADILLTGMILTGLVQAKTGWPSTDRVVRRLIRYVGSSRFLSAQILTTKNLSGNAAARYDIRYRLFGHLPRGIAQR